MRIRRWIKSVAASLIGMVALVYAAHWVLPQPWWLKEAGPPPSPFFMVTSSGTGFFVTTDGWLLTNRHVTAGCSRVSVGNAKLSGLVADTVLYPADTQLDLAAVHVALHSPAFLSFAVTPRLSAAPVSETSAAEVADAFVRAADRSAGDQGKKKSADLDASVVRVFCFR